MLLHRKNLLHQALLLLLLLLLLRLLRRRMIRARQRDRLESAERAADSLEAARRLEARGCWLEMVIRGRDVRRLEVLQLYLLLRV